MTNALSVISNRPQFLAAPGDASIGDEFAGGVGPSFPLGVLSIRGKEFRLRKGGQEVPLKTRNLQVIMVRARPTVSKRWYADKYAAGSTAAPDCSSVDGARPDLGVPKKQCDNCASCPQNQWGSQITERGSQGKACSDYKRLVIKVVDMGGGKSLPEPLVLDVPATSLRAPKSYKGQDMMLAEYVQFVTKNGGAPHQLVTELEFTDSEYPQVSFKPARWLSEAEYNDVLELRKHDDVETVLAEPTHEPAGAVTETQSGPAMPAGVPPQQSAPAQPAAQPATQQAPAPQSNGTNEVDIDSLFGGAAPTNTAPPAAQQAPEPAPAQAAQQPAQPAPEPAQAQAEQEPSDDDVMAEINKILGG